MFKTQLVTIAIGSVLGGAMVQAALTACGKVSAPLPDARADTMAVIAPAGTIASFAGQTPPEGWLLCDGSEISRMGNAALFAVIGTIYGQGDQVNTFNLPDLRGRTVVGTGMGTGLSARTLAQTGGEEQHTLTVAEMPSHTHREQGTNRLDGAAGGATHYQDVDNPNFGPVTTAAAGGDKPHNTMPPFIALHYIIKT